MKDFFISYTAADAKWAEWIAWQLEVAGYQVLFQKWDFLASSNFVLMMHEGITQANATLAILSEEYLTKAFPASEWAAAFAKDPKGQKRSLILVRISAVEPDGLLGPISYIDLCGVCDENAAKEKLLAGVKGVRNKPLVAPNFPLLGNPENTIAPTFPCDQNKSRMSKLKRFVCQKISNIQLLNLDGIDYPYDALSDPTEFVEETGACAINCLLWIPQSQYIKSSPLQRYTPSVAICFQDKEEILANFNEQCSENLATLLTLRASKLRDQEKRAVFSVLGRVYRRSFIAAITLPDIMLQAGRQDPMVAYSSFFDMLLLPLVQMHKKYKVKRFLLVLPNIGDQSKYVVKTSKRIIKAIYHEKNSFEVILSNGDDGWSKISNGARLIAWAIGVAHNQKNEKWLEVLDKELEDAASSHTEETAS